MSMLTRLRNLWRREAFDSELDEELQVHVEMRVERNLEAGMDRDTAEAEARRHLGGRLRAREGMHDAGSAVWIESWTRDLAYAVRTLRRQPWFTAVAALTFAVGIGLNVAVFSVVDRVLVRELPYHEPDRLAFVRLCSNGCGTAFPAALADALAGLSSVDGVAFAGFPGPFTLTRETDSVSVTLFGASPGLLGVLGVAPVLGRDFTQDDLSDGRRVALISYERWRTTFAGAAGIVGTEIWSRGEPRTIVGVLPPGFIPPVWIARIPEWDGFYLIPAGSPLVRLRGDVTAEVAQEEIRRVARSIEREWSSIEYFRNVAQSVRVDPLETALFELERPGFALFLGATTVLLLLACANLSTLLLARARARDRDMAIAAALGATRTRLVRQAFFESWLVCGLGSAVALSVLVAAEGALTSLLPPLVARYTAPVTETRVLTIAIGLAMACAALAGASPATRGARLDLLAVLQRNTVSARRARSIGRAGLIAAEAALGVVLVVSALLMIRTLTRVTNDDVGYQPKGLYLIDVGTAAASMRETAFFEQVADALRHVPGIIRVAIADSAGPGIGNQMPFASFTTQNGFRGSRFEVSAPFFETAGVPIIAGRSFTASEARQRASVAVLGSAAVSAFWPGETPDAVIGRVLSLEGEPPLRVVGIVPDFKRTPGETSSLIAPPVYLPYGLHTARAGQMLVRTADGLAPSIEAVQRHVRARLAGVTTVVVSPVEDRYTAALAEPRFRAVLFGTLALSGLLLAVTGLYAVAAFDARQREYELGVRLAHGATPGDVRRLVITRGLAPVLVGLAAGLIAAFWATTRLQQFLYQVEPRNPGIFAAVVGIMIATAFAAAWFPAWRASRLDPATVLRAE